MSTQRWIRLSLVGGLLSAMWGTLLTVYAFWPFSVFALLTVLLCSRLLTLGEGALRLRFIATILVCFLGELVVLLCKILGGFDLRIALLMAVPLVLAQVWAMIQILRNGEAPGASVPTGA